MTFRGGGPRGGTIHIRSPSINDEATSFNGSSKGLLRAVDSVDEYVAMVDKGRFQIGFKVEEDKEERNSVREKEKE